MRLTRLAALSLLLWLGALTAALERAAAKDAAPPMAQGVPRVMAQATLTPTPPDAPPPAAQPAPPPPPAAAPPPPRAAAPPPAAPGGSSSAVTHNNVNLRNGPGTNYMVLTLIPAGSSVEVNGCQGGWCEAAFQGQTGFIVESSIAPGAPGAAQARPRPGYYAGPPAAYGAPPPGYYPPPPPAYGYSYYPYGPYYRPYWGWRHGYWRRW